MTQQLCDTDNATTMHSFPHRLLKRHNWRHKNIKQRWKNFVASLHSRGTLCECDTARGRCGCIVGVL